MGCNGSRPADALRSAKQKEPQGGTPELPKDDDCAAHSVVASSRTSPQKGDIPSQPVVSFGPDSTTAEAPKAKGEVPPIRQHSITSQATEMPDNDSEQTVYVSETSDTSTLIGAHLQLIRVVDGTNDLEAHCACLDEDFVGCD